MSINIVQSIPLEERLFILSKAYESISRHYIHWEDAVISSADLDLYYKDFLKRVIKTEDKAEFSRLMLEFLYPLSNRHTIYWDKTINDDRIPWDNIENVLPMGYAIEYIDDCWTITESLVKGLEPGDKIISINGEPIDALVKYLSKYLH